MLRRKRRLTSGASFEPQRKDSGRAPVFSIIGLLACATLLPAYALVEQPHVSVKPVVYDLDVPPCSTDLERADCYRLGVDPIQPCDISNRENPCAREFYAVRR